MVKKESRQFNISVEGINCEKLYFEHLAILINSSNSNTYNLKIDPKKMGPLEYAKRNAYKPVDKRRSNKKLPYIHIQDIEDYYDDYQRCKFYNLIDDMRTAEDKFGIEYELGYTNYTFELWMLLHVTDMQNPVMNRKKYLTHINKWFNRDFTDLDEFKKAHTFQDILDEYVSLDSVKQAINRAEIIVNNNCEEHKKRETYNKFSFYRDNPDLTIHEVVKLIFEVCGVR